jgi:hypothetical protein
MVRYARELSCVVTTTNAWSFASRLRSSSNMRHALDRMRLEVSSLDFDGEYSFDFISSKLIHEKNRQMYTPSLAIAKRVQGDHMHQPQSDLLQQPHPRSPSDKRRWCVERMFD